MSDRPRKRYEVHHEYSVCEIYRVFVAQLAERESHNLEVEGSSPSEGILFEFFGEFQGFFKVLGGTDPVAVTGLEVTIACGVQCPLINLYQ